MLGALAPLLDSTIVNVAIHTLGAELHAAVSTVQWVSTAYLLALVIRGAGLSAVNLAVMVGAFRDLEPEQIPDGSSTTRIMQQLRGASAPRRWL